MKKYLLNLMLSGVSFGFFACGGMEPATQEDIDSAEQEILGQKGHCEVVGGHETGFCIAPTTCGRTSSKGSCPLNSPAYGTVSACSGLSIDTRLCNP